MVFLATTLKHQLFPEAQVLDLNEPNKKKTQMITVQWLTAGNSTLSDRPGLWFSAKIRRGFPHCFDLHVFEGALLNSKTYYCCRFLCLPGIWSKTQQVIFVVPHNCRLNINFSFKHNYLYLIVFNSALKASWSRKEGECRGYTYFLLQTC